MDVQIKTWNNGYEIYQEETVPHWLFKDQREQLSFRRICLSDEGVAKQLVAMGWTPPPNFKIGGLPWPPSEKLTDSEGSGDAD